VPTQPAVRQPSADGWPAGGLASKAIFTDLQGENICSPAPRIRAPHPSHAEGSREAVRKSSCRQRTAQGLGRIEWCQCALFWSQIRAAPMGLVGSWITVRQRSWGRRRASGNS